MAKRHVRPNQPEPKYKVVRVKLPEHVYLPAKAICILKKIRINDLITAYLASWAKSADKDIDAFISGV